MSADRVEEAERAEETGSVAAEGVATLAATANAVRYYSVAPGVRLNVRRGPGTAYGIVRVLPEGARIPIYCQTPGTNVSGPYGTSNIWDNIDDGEFVADAYVQTGSDGYVRPRCS
ncbi:SH3 domain-containing protein [Streptomyces sp. WAC 01325]|uniref:SH3 domain-containing protein n=1 Tax=Streptomyces TaxID=1883 RepID=UPI000F897922|nr:SH3 domain-containing protein [Streptomyces sp. WAC 01325]RSM85347.1 SH3 domain-containing protein [Streptomyces sp. WAC 01325]WCH92081.1 SH3 domain-containing protein [Streptomyces moderatus]